MGKKEVLKNQKKIPIPLPSYRKQEPSVESATESLPRYEKQPKIKVKKDQVNELPKEESSEETNIAEEVTPATISDDTTVSSGTASDTPTTEIRTKNQKEKT